jgi:hypothetical protein
MTANAGCAGNYTETVIVLKTRITLFPPGPMLRNRGLTRRPLRRDTGGSYERKFVLEKPRQDGSRHSLGESSLLIQMCSRG